MSMAINAKKYILVTCPECGKLAMATLEKRSQRLDNELLDFIYDGCTVETKVYDATAVLPEFCKCSPAPAPLNETG